MPRAANTADVPTTMREAVGYEAIEGHEGTTEDLLVLKHDRLFLLLNDAGEVAPAGKGGLGLYFDDTRILSHYALRLTGGPATVLSSQVPELFRAQLDLAVGDEAFGGTHWDPTNAIHIRRELLLHDRLFERVTLTNYMTFPVDYRVELGVAADFADIFEVRGWERERRGEFFRPVIRDRTLLFRYEGRDGASIRTQVRFAEPVPEIDPSGAGWSLSLEPGRSSSLAWEVLPTSVRSPRTPTGRRLDRRGARLEKDYEAWRSGSTKWSTDVAEFDLTLAHAVDDLRGLYTESEGESVICAGIPWYCTPFGRDALITALQTLSVNPEIAVDTLRYLALHQGRREDPVTEEQPGRIMHELRRGEMARSGEIPHVPYYGTVDATPLWLILLHETWRWLGDRELVRELLPHALRALEWIDRYGDLDGDGFVEYERTSPKGLLNQGWKDSSRGVPFPDGEPARPPIALVEVQGYVHDAKLRTAALLESFGDSDRARTLRKEAAELRDRIRDRFWLEELGTFALALDRHKTPLPTVTSNAGHLLWSRVPSYRQADRMGKVLLGRKMFCGWGLRTLSSAHPAFNPMSYHNGSVWPHDNALVVMGLAFYRQGERALPILDGLHSAAASMRHHRLPELLCGMERRPGMRPVLYPVSCSPQAWASGAFFMMLQAVTGLLPEAHRGILHVQEPHLPPFLRELTLTGLRVGQTRVSLQFRRHGQRTLANLLSLEGAPLHVRIELS